MKAPVVECSECGKRLKPIWKDIQSNPDTWFWLECDTCNDPVCEDCSETNEGGETECDSCMQTTALRLLT